MKEESGYKNAYDDCHRRAGIKLSPMKQNAIDLYDPQLTLNGLRMIHEKVQKKDEKLKIGNVELENRYLLGPMAGVTDLPFRCCARNRERVF